jgi:hypothetical protein
VISIFQLCISFWISMKIFVLQFVLYGSLSENFFLFVSYFSCHSFILGLHRQVSAPVSGLHLPSFPLGFLFSPLPDLSFCFGFAAISKIFVCRAFQSWILCRTCFESSARSADLRQGQFSWCAIFVRSFQSPREGSAVFRFSVFGVAAVSFPRTRSHGCTVSAFCLGLVLEWNGKKSLPVLGPSLLISLLACMQLLRFARSVSAR